MIANAVDQSAQMDDVSELTNELRKLSCSCRLEGSSGSGEVRGVQLLSFFIGRL